MNKKVTNGIDHTLFIFILDFFLFMCLVRQCEYTPSNGRTREVYYICVVRNVVRLNKNEYYAKPDLI